MAALNHAFGGRRFILAGAVTALLGLAACGLGLALGEARRALLAWLIAFAYVASIAVGALIWLMIGYAANARWMSVTRRLCEGIAIGVLPLALLFLPIAFGLGWIYPWVDLSPRALAALPEQARHLLEHKRPYLNSGFFLLRTGLYFAIWILAAALLRSFARRHARRAETPDDPLAALARERALSSALLPLVGLAITFAAFDWLMSLQPTWFSTIFGIYYFAGGFLGAMALLSLLTWAARRSGATGDAVTRHHFHALGRLLFAFTVFWAYTAFFQAFLIRIADRPIEISFYLHRAVGDWRLSIWLLAIGHFALPFLLLLPRSLKHRPGWVAAVAAWLLAMHWFDVYWLVAPLAGGGIVPHWLDLAALAAIGGGTVAACAFMLRGRPLLATHDPLFADGVGYASPT